MARPRKLPDNEDLKKLLSTGATYDDIARRYGVTAQAVGDLVNRWGLNVEPRHVSLKDYIPWRVPTEHHGEYPRRMLYLYAKQQTGRDLTAKQAGQVKLFTEKLDAAFDGQGGVIAYAPGHEKGPFIVVPRREQDTHYVRRPDPAPGPADAGIVA